MQATLADRAKLRAFDADANAEISSDELQNGLERIFADMDKNRDGVLKVSEIAAANQKLGIEDSAMPPLRDWNQSGAVEFDEFAAWNRGRFRRADADEDGIVTQAELTRPPRIGPPGAMPPAGMPPGGKPPGGKPPGGGMPGGGMPGGGMPGGRLSQSVANSATGGS